MRIKRKEQAKGLYKRKERKFLNSGLVKPEEYVKRIWKSGNTRRDK